MLFWLHIHHLFIVYCKLQRSWNENALENAYQWEARSQWPHAPLKGDIQVSITIFFGTQRRADIDNFNKLSLDALTGLCTMLTVR